MAGEITEHLLHRIERVGVVADKTKRHVLHPPMVTLVDRIKRGMVAAIERVDKLLVVSEIFGLRFCHKRTLYEKARSVAGRSGVAKARRR